MLPQTHMRHCSPTALLCGRYVIVLTLTTAVSTYHQIWPGTAGCDVYIEGLFTESWGDINGY